MTDELIQYDVFISYAREDLEWVHTHLYEPLLHCRTVDGRRPHIFVDISEEGIRIGENWISSLAVAIKNCRKFVAVYSTHYFIKPMCKWERHQAFLRDPIGDLGLYIPILKEAEAAGLVPPEVGHLNYWKVATTGWFEQLCDALKLQPVAEVLRLQFQDKLPSATYINHTLPPVRVALLNEKSQPITHDGTISLHAENTVLRGTLVQPIKNGVATFDDLLVEMPIRGARLVATMDGSTPAVSELLDVLEPTIIKPPAAAPYIPPISEHVPVMVVFYPDGQALAVIDAGQARVYPSTGQGALNPVGQCDLHGPLRLWHCVGNQLVLAGWDGTVDALWKDGRHASWDLSKGGKKFAVPGALTFGDDGALYVGLWSGMIYRLEAGMDPIPILRHREGVQALVAADSRMYVCSFDGTLHVYANGRRVNGSQLEPTIHLLQAIDQVIICVGEQKLYQVQRHPFTVFSDKSPLPNTLAAYSNGSRSVIVSPDGQGVSLDSELTIRAKFRTAPGARPISADRTDHMRVFSSPDGSFSLIHDSRIVFTHNAGPLAVAPSEDKFALGDQTGIRLLTEAQMKELFQKESSHVN